MSSRVYWEIFQQQGHECASSTTECTRVSISRKATQYLVSGLATRMPIIGHCNHRTSTSVTSCVEVHEGSVYERVVLVRPHAPVAETFFVALDRANM
jgi:hypothetical protein